jgi:hypothetical protein
MSRNGYAYSIIRYVHDPISGECLNVGVVLSSQNGFFEARVPSSLVRVKNAFPDASVNTIRYSFESFESRLETLLKTTGDFAEALSLALPPDEGSLKASVLGAGLTSDLSATADELLDRFVLRCERDFEDAQVTENKEYRVAWQFGSAVTMVDCSNDEMYQLADVQLLRA